MTLHILGLLFLFDLPIHANFFVLNNYTGVCTLYRINVHNTFYTNLHNIYLYSYAIVNFIRNVTKPINVRPPPPKKKEYPLKVSSVVPSHFILFSCGGSCP